MSKPRLFMPQYIGEIVYAYVKVAPMVFPRSVICMEFASELKNACGKKRLLSPFFMMKFDTQNIFFHVIL